MSPKRIPTIALDGPSALTLYRDRGDLEQQAKQIELARDAQETPDFHLSDEDIAYFMSLDEGIYYPSDEDIAYFMSLDEDPDFSHIPAAAIASQSVYEATTSKEPPASSVLPPLTRSRFRSAARCSAKSRDLKLTPFEELGVRPPSPDSPLYLLTSRSNRRHVNNTHCRACEQPLPPESFKRLGPDILVPTPELTFLLLARYASLPELVALGMEMCGHYRMCGASSENLLRSETTVYDCRQLTTTQKLREFAEKSVGFYGANRAIKACRHIAPHSCSPMETVLYLLLYLPRTLGGYGLKKPVLNAKRTVHKRAGSIVFSKTLKPDLFWPESNLDMEYDSDEFHSDPAALTKGARRTLALQVMHVHVVSMTYDVMRDDTAFHAVVRSMAPTLKARLPKAATPPNAKSTALRALLLP